MALDVKISFSWTNYCRLCLLDNGIMLPLFEGEGESRQLRHKIETCFQLVTYDGDPLPRRICHKCLYMLNQTYDFRTTAVSSFERLKTHLLPLKHVPEVQQYLEKADQFQRSMDPNSDPTPQFSSPSMSSTSSRGESLIAKPTRIRIKSERELVDEDPSCSPGPSPSFMNSVADDSYLCNSTLTTLVPLREPIPLLDDDGLQHDSLKRKRLCVNSDGTARKPLGRSVSPILKKAKGKRQLAGPASRKRDIQNSMWKCVFCSSQFGSKRTLNVHVDKCLKCGTCQKEFSSVAEKAIHEADEHICVIVDGEKKHLRRRCSRCPAQFASGIMLSMHSKFDHVSSMKQEPIQSQTRDSAAVSDSTFSPPAVHEEATNSRIANGEVNGVQKGGSDGSQSDESVTSKVSCVPSGKDCTHFCATCEEAFSSVRMLLKHEKIIHGRFRCAQCVLSFSSQNALNSHKRFHTSKIMNRKKTLGKDASSTTKIVTTGKKTLSCHTCYEEFEEEDSFILHLYRHATEESDSDEVRPKKSRKGPILPKKRKEKLDTSTAIQSANSADSDGPDNLGEQFSIKCERCHVVCRSKEYYQVHLATHMSKAKTRFPCSGCNQDFRNVEALNRHTCCGKQSEDMQSCCLDCGQALVKSEDHICDNKCPECDKVFKSSRGQRLHFVSKHSNRVPADDGFLNDAELMGLDTAELEEDHEEPELDEKPVEKVSSVARQSENEYSSVCDSEVGSSAGESPPRERLPPDGAPPEAEPCQPEVSPEPELCKFDSIPKDTASLLVSENSVPLLPTENHAVESENSLLRCLLQNPNACESFF